MAKRNSPKLRTVNKSVAAYPLNQFNSDFPYVLGQEIVYLLASKGRGDLEGSEWERIFAICIGVDWKPSNVGLDDVVIGNTAWGAKTVKSNVKDFGSLWFFVYLCGTTRRTVPQSFTKATQSYTKLLLSSLCSSVVL